MILMYYIYPCLKVKKIIIFLSDNKVIHPIRYYIISFPVQVDNTSDAWNHQKFRSRSGTYYITIFHNKNFIRGSI